MKYNVFTVLVYAIMFSSRFSLTSLLLSISTFFFSSWVIYVPLFVAGCVILWFLITTLVVCFHLVRESNVVLRPSCLRRCSGEEETEAAAPSQRRISYKQIIDYDVSRVPVVSSADSISRVFGELGAGTSMDEYVSSMAPVPVCPQLEMVPRSQDSGDDSADETTQLWSHFPDENPSHRNASSDDNCRTHEPRRQLDSRWRDNFNCDLTRLDYVQPSNSSTDEEQEDET